MYHKGRKMKTSTVTLFHIYKSDMKLDFHFHLSPKDVVEVAAGLFPYSSEPIRKQRP